MLYLLILLICGLLGLLWIMAERMQRIQAKIDDKVIARLDTTLKTNTQVLASSVNILGNTQIIRDDVGLIIKSMDIVRQNRGKI